MRNLARFTAEQQFTAAVPCVLKLTNTPYFPPSQFAVRVKDNEVPCGVGGGVGVLGSTVPGTDGQ